MVNKKVPSNILNTGAFDRLSLLKLGLLLLLKGRLSRRRVYPPLRPPSLAENDEEHDWDEEEADQGLEHGDQTLDLVVVVILLILVVWKKE